MAMEWDAADFALGTAIEKQKHVAPIAVLLFVLYTRLFPVQIAYELKVHVHVCQEIHCHL